MSEGLALEEKTQVPLADQLVEAMSAPGQKISALPVIGSLRHKVMGGILQTFFSSLMMVEVTAIVYAMGWEDRLLPFESRLTAIVVLAGYLAVYVEYAAIWLTLVTPEATARFHLGLVVWHFLRWSIFLGAIASDNPVAISLVYSIELVVVLVRLAISPIFGLPVSLRILLTAS